MISKSHTKYIQSLQHKKFRDASGCFFAEGPKVVAELLTSHKFVCTQIFATPEWINDNPQLIKNLSGTSIETIADFELEKISALSTPNQVLAIFEQQQQGCNASGKITLALDTIQDPGNLGTIIRIADWFGIENIICSNGCADCYNPKVVQSTMGSLARVNIHYTDLFEWLNENKALPVYAAALEGKNIKTLQHISEAIIVIGNEAKGVSPEIMESVNQKITIQKKGMAESLNAAIATGIILSHIC